MEAYHVPRCSRRCWATGRTLQPGEGYYSVLLWEGGELVRRDYSVEAWHGPPEEAIGWWRGEVPSGPPKPDVATPEQLLAWLEQLLQQPEQADLCYVLALLLVRRRVLRLERETTGPEGPVLELHTPGPEPRSFRVPVRQPEPQRLHEIEQQLKKVLFPQLSRSPSEAKTE